jgi:ATP-binding cassette subfamily B protein
MESGEIVERGTHNNLLQQNGIYARMWALQQQEQNLEI